MTMKVATTAETLMLFQNASAGERKINVISDNPEGTHVIFEGEK